MATMKILSSPIGRQLSTILSRKIGNSCVVRDDQMIGPFGGIGWRKYLLSDGRIVIIGEKMGSRRDIPKWIKSQFKKLTPAGSGCGWRAYITEEPEGCSLPTDGCTCQNCGRIYRVDFIIADEIWEKIKPNAAGVGCGLLCGSCITQRMETFFSETGKFGKFDII